VNNIKLMKDIGGLGVVISYIGAAIGFGMVLQKSGIDLGGKPEPLSLSGQIVFAAMLLLIATALSLPALWR